jgi:hypothetical protein
VLGNSLDSGASLDNGSLDAGSGSVSDSENGSKAKLQAVASKISAARELARRLAEEKAASQGSGVGSC